MPTYATPQPVKLVIRIPSGRIEITTEDTQETTVNVRRLDGRGGKLGPDDVVVDFRPSQREAGELVVVAERGHKSWFGRDAAYEIQIRTPHGADVEAASGSADIRGTGRFGSVDVQTASGDVSFDDLTGHASVKSASGDIHIGDIEGTVKLNTVSGDAEIGKAGGDLSASLVSGDLRVATVAGGVKGRSVSGDLRIGSFDRGRANLNTVSGDVEIAVPPDRRVWMDVVSRTGDTSCDLDVNGGGDSAGGKADVEIEAHSVSGDVRIRRAAANASA
jgi:DUF4097 and DUF4098 domain-containing protein YvlB